jgi:hypothetical protein
MPSTTASASSSQLRALLADLDVDGAAPIPRRTGGGGGDRLIDRMEDLDADDSPTGTSQKSTIVGVPFTVISGLDMDLDEKEESSDGDSTPFPSTRKERFLPRTVRVQLPKQSGPAKTFSVMRLSHDLDVFSLFCRATIGKSGTFCIIRNCTVNHQGPVAKIKPGSLVVVKLTGKAAFLNPVVKSEVFDQTLLGEWLTLQETLETWTVKFDQVRASATFVTKVNAAAFEVTRDEERRAEDFKTPRTKKRRSADHDTTERIGISPYARAMLNGPEAFEEMSAEEQLERLIQMVIALDSGVDQLGTFCVTLGQDIENVTNTQNVSNQMLEHKVNMIKRTLGSKPDHLASDIEAPTVWGAIAETLEKCEAGNGKADDKPSEDKRLFLAFHKEWQKKSSMWEADLVTTASTLSKAIQAQGRRIDNVQMSGKGVPTSGPPPSSIPVDALKEELNDVRTEVRKIQTENKPHVVKFGGLNLDSKQKAEAWISTNLASEDIGLVVDPHTVFEHIWANFTGGEFLKNFERVHKLEVSTLSQGYSMTSFEQPIPKFFSKAGAGVIKDDASYLSRIITWADWDFPDTGLRQALNNELEIFKNSHRLEIENTLDQDSRVYAIACLALSDSVSIVEALIKFIDDFVKHLTTAKFSFKKAFHVTTRLLKRILTEIFVPRQGVLKTFKTGNMEATAVSIFWSTIRSLDIALGFKRTGFENLHIVSSELVKFLLVNTGYESISGLEVKVATLEGQVSELSKTVKNADKSALTASNKSDELKKLCDALTKRVTKLEGRAP